jgi:diguanylate cyclase (GGDEF)-like protein/PAS domain S-box-containing protein
MLGATGAAELRLTRLLDFNGLLARINHAISVHDGEDALLQEICDLAARDAHLALAYVARPGADGQFRFIAATGRVQALDGVRISVDAADPLGRGSVGRCWRDGVAQFHDAYAAEATLQPWHAHARAHGLRSSAALPLRRGGVMWGVLAVYHEHEAVFDAELQRLLGQLALDVSRGLDRLELLGREKRSRALRESLLNNALVGIVMTRGRRIVDANAHFASMLGRDSPRELVGRETRALYPDDESFERVKALYRELHQTGSAQLTSAVLRTRAGAIINCDLSANMVREAGHRLVVWTVVDVTERDRLQKQVAYESLHDTLTGLANRRALRRELPRILARAQRHDRVAALGLIDLDDFKPVNDTFGHDAGDRLLCELAARLGARLRAGDLLVRLGGDEFVVVFEDLDPAHAVEQLEHALQRLGEAVAAPFMLGGRDAAEVSMTMGVALYPQDARDPDALIRQADAAMYQCKQRKHARVQWWGLVAPAAAASEPDPEPDGDAFDAAAQALLARAQRQIGSAGERFAEQFYAELERDASARAVLLTLTADERARLLRRQTAHLQFLLDPATSRDEIRQRARHLGLVHALTGVNGAWLSRAQSLYRRLLAEQLNHVALGARERLRTMFVADARLQEDVQVELEVQGTTTAAYLDLLAAPLPAPGARWVDVSEAALAELGALPGVPAVLLLRLRRDGVLAVERSAGPRAQALAELLQTPGREAVLDARSPRGQGASALAWRNLRIETSASLTQDPRYRGWFALAGAPATQGLRSSLSVPLVDAAGQAVGVLAFFGEWPNQFESPVMRQFARGVKSRWEQLWGLCSAPAAVIAQDEARAYRARLFDGGLRMHVQPIVDLHDGRLLKVEALARLEMPDGRIVPPAQFLPLLGSAELDRLFELGLEQSLEQLARWDAAGVSLELALNLAPCTLHDGCARSVDAALRRHTIAPPRLCLELLEGERIDTAEQQRELECLRALGVKLAMDDLGTGYSSLQRLSRLPFDAIKIDRSLLQQLSERPLPTLALLGAIVRMGRDVGVEIVVEGLEREAEIEVARALGADRGQGWAIARPMAADTLLDWHAARGAGDFDCGPRHALGALAWCWSARCDAGAPRDADALSAYLRGHAANEPQAAAWLARLERGDADPAQLQLWLLDRVQRL